MTFVFAMAVMVLHILILGVMNFRARAGGYKRGAVPGGYFMHLDHAKYEVPEFVVRMGRHYDNQFELPMLYLITCVVCLVLPVLNPIAVAAAWLFLFTRLGHSYEHLGRNFIPRRAAWFFAGWACVAAMWVVILFHEVTLLLT